MTHPQYPAVPSDDESTIQPIHEIDPTSAWTPRTPSPSGRPPTMTSPAPTGSCSPTAVAYSDWTRESSRHEAIAPALLIPLAEMAGSALSGRPRARAATATAGRRRAATARVATGWRPAPSGRDGPWQAHLENPEVGGQRQAFYRPAGLSDRYIEIEADANADYHRNPVAQFRHDPEAYINRIGHLHSADLLDPRMGDYANLGGGRPPHPGSRLERRPPEGLRLRRREGRVHVDYLPDRIYAMSRAMTGTYTTMISKRNSFAGLPAGKSIGLGAALQLLGGFGP